MYIEHPYLYEGKYYAKVGNQFIEITKELAYARNNFYSNSSPKKVDIKDENGEIVSMTQAIFTRRNPVGLY